MNVKIKTSLQRKEELMMLISSDMIGKIINDEIHNKIFEMKQSNMFQILIK